MVLGPCFTALTYFSRDFNDNSVGCNDIKTYINLLYFSVSDYFKEHFALTFRCSEFKKQNLGVKERQMSWLLLTQASQAVYIPCKNNCVINLHLKY